MEKIKKLKFPIDKWAITCYNAKAAWRSEQNMGV
jgi:hypothetical protein